MKKKLAKIGLPFACVSLFGVATISLSTIHSFEMVSADQTIDKSSFVSVDNFVFSGKGISMVFTFDIPTSETTNSFCFMGFKNGEWHRLTSYVTMTFKTNGEVKVSKGDVYKIEDVYVYQVMLSELSDILNTGEGVDGHNKLEFLYFNKANVRIDCLDSSVIESTINVTGPAEIRNGEKPGLRFKAHLPSINSNSTYGMIIVPNQYVASQTGDYINYLNNNSLHYVDMSCTPQQVGNSGKIYDTFGSGYFIQGSLTNIKPEHYQVPFCCIPYEKDSLNKYHFGNLIHNGKSTLYDVALKSIENGDYSGFVSTTKNFIDGAIYTCEHHDVNLETTNVMAYAVNNDEQVLKTDPIPDSYSTTIKLSAARNESEGGQVIISLKNAINKKYYVNFEPFVNLNDNSKKIPASAVTISKMIYQNVQTNWACSGDQNQTYYHNQKETLPLGWFPDALLPFDTAIDSGENLLNANNGSNNGIYFNVDVPKDASSGKYTSKVVIRILGEGTIVLPVELDVANFTLPSENKSKYTIQVDTGEISALYGSSFSDKSGVLYKSAYEELAKRGISGGQVPASCWSTDQLPAYVDAVKKSTLDDRIGAIYLSNSSDYCNASVTYTYKQGYLTKTKTVTSDYVVFRGKDKQDGKATVVGTESVLKALVEASTNECNLLKKLVVYFPQADEPGSNESAQLQNVLCENSLRNSIDYVASLNIFAGKESVKESLLSIPYIVTSSPKTLLNGGFETATKITSTTSNASDFYVDSLSSFKYRKVTGYCPTYDCFDTSGSGYADLMGMLQNKTANVWWYGCCLPIAPYNVNFVNSPLVRKRSNGVLGFKLGIQGELYYMCNRTRKIVGGEGQEGTTYDVQTEQGILLGDATYNGAYGDGQYIYPVRNLYRNINTNLNWLSSMRLETLGEANDDINYLYYAYELIESSDANATVKQGYYDRLDSAINAVCSNGPLNNTKDSELFAQQRNNVIKIIEELANL